ncbi:MAG: PhoH family protein [Deferribacteres bacterium]|nr:PhoH family protein [candidate division KSB1 bacterium]MCB9502995.1 PhoH family protein [Deferribacteres bacterium]
MNERQIEISGIDYTQFLGANDKNFKKIASEIKCTIAVRGHYIILKGEQEELDFAEKLLTELILLFNKHNELYASDIDTVVSVLRKKDSYTDTSNGKGDWPAILYTKDNAIKPKTFGQAEYVDKVNNNDLVFAIGPAGTGKTYMAVALAVAHLRDRFVSRIILTRPAVEAGENLGYLPGDMMEKVDPYLRPLYDALGDMIPQEKLQKYIQNRIIEVVPLAFMRGRTLNSAFLILDEAQNTTPGQMKMLLTRLGVNSKAIVTGDITQIDLAANVESGLIQVQSVLKNVPGVDFVYLTDQDVVRHRLVREIIKAYDSFKQSSNQDA